MSGIDGKEGRFFPIASQAKPISKDAQQQTLNTKLRIKNQFHGTSTSPFSAIHKIIEFNMQNTCFWFIDL